MGIFTEVCDDCTRRVVWVPTSYQLPEHHKPVLVSGGLAYLDGNSLWRTYMERCFDGTPRLLNWVPKYWAPLPKPPE